MTITGTQCSVSYTTDGLSNTFPVPFVFYGPDELAVTQSNATNSIVTTMIRGTNYDVIGGNGLTGTVLAINPPAIGFFWTIRRRTARTQQSDYIDFDPFPAATTETALDRLTAQSQETDETINRTIRAPIGEASIGTLPTATARALKMLGFDAAGSPIAATPSSALISAAMQPVAAAATTAAAMINLGIPAWAQSILGAANSAAGLNAFLGANILTASPAVAFGPVGNAFPTLGAIVQQGTTTSANLREFAGSFGLESVSGLGGSTGGIHADKVALYAGIEGFAGSGDIWAFNTVTRLAPGFPAAGFALGYELDFNNQGGDRGATVGLGGFAAPTAIGLLVTGASTYGSTAAISVQGPSSTQWHRGLGVASGVSDHAIYDYSNANTSLAITGTHAGWGIDMLGAVLGGGVRLPNNSGIFGRNAANSADIAAVTVNTINGLLLGTDSAGAHLASGIYMGAGTVPFVDNSYVIGNSTNRWAAVWAVNGAIQTSDPRLKTDVQPLPEALPIIASIEPRTFKWIDGGDGAPGRRTHWGFLAPDLKAGFDRTGLDFGGYVRGEDGSEHMRPDQLIPVLWKGLQEAAARIATLEAAGQPPASSFED